jgi:hypothetical protein
VRLIDGQTEEHCKTPAGRGRSRMSLIEMAQFAPFWGYGLWLAMFPHSAIRFYSGIYKRSTGGKRKVMPRPLFVRICGLAVLGALALAYWRKGV